MLDLRFSAETALAPLKAFQRRTVDYAFARLFTDPDRTRQFLVADEVGLGKTMVARGVIAKAIELMQDSVPRIDIVYICSNGAIAQQNLARLNVLGNRAHSLPTRLTLLPLQLGGDKGLRRNRINFISLTPGTTFDLKSSTGTARERALIVRILDDLLTPGDGKFALFRVGSREDTWQVTLADIRLQSIDEEIAARFRARVASEPGLLDDINDLAKIWMPRSGIERAMRARRDPLIARLRGLLAKECVAALEPDLIILDEFQRFHEVLHGTSEAAELAQQLFEYIDENGQECRTLLLSATPYRMLTLSGDSPEEGNHYTDFLEVMRFLFGKENGLSTVADLERELQHYRDCMLALPSGFDAAREARVNLESRLRRVVARTERVGETEARDSMVREVAETVDVMPADLLEARAVSAVAVAARAPGTLEYWKSAPYLMSFMRDYKLRERLDSQANNPTVELRSALKSVRPFQLNRSDIDQYQSIPLNNGRMRALKRLAFEADLARRLWLPPSLPYFGARIEATKALVFSAWSMVPDAISALLSHEAEREMGMGADGHGYFDRPTSRPIQFREAQGRLAGLRALQLVCPSPTLAAAVDPLHILRENKLVQDHHHQRIAAMSALEPLARDLHRAQTPPDREVTWDWASLAWIDLRQAKSFMDWIQAPDGLTACGDEEAWPAHVSALHAAAQVEGLLGSVELSDLASHLADVALGSPATCALRAFSRIAPDLELSSAVMLTSAAKVGMGFRSLFNQPESQALLRASEEGYYWQSILRFCVEHDLQSVLDEYVHVLLEAEGLQGHPSEKAVPKLADAMVAALSLRPAQIDVDQFGIRRGKIVNTPFRMRGRFAMRLAPRGEDESGEQRTGLVREAFNSPFRPFVLASTSVGQEGLDFHPYCHRLIHWNLPSNPVDLEQREGRVHRYKSHAVRLNIAAAQSCMMLNNDDPDPWASMFRAAKASAQSNSDLEPYWICPGSTRVERHTLLFPFSREVSRLAWLKQSVAVYRLAFGQPRQDDLLAWLSKLQSSEPEQPLSEFQISLKP
ncbi:DEAD/DEAH box helicase [Tabrizicola sp. J26]|uniref:helicase-related protein n=1 Tax=Alitabrizicola rongguiensis TaxID=2909234 RepID=UPI001F4242C6|nr:helicase-related protein [Tabrizicola rongguiensis]MCF1708701.1 DEAD/DEAH box helicase [Tabrizicola rongguiensis]